MDMHSISRSISMGKTGSKKKEFGLLLSHKYSEKLQEEGGTRKTNFSPTEEE